MMLNYLVACKDQNGHTRRNDTVCSDHYLTDRELLALCPNGEYLEVIVLEGNRCLKIYTIER